MVSYCVLRDPVTFEGDGWNGGLSHSYRLLSRPAQ